MRNYYRTLLIISCIAFSLNAFEENIIEVINVTKRRVEITVNKEFKKLYLQSNFFAEYEANIDLTALDRSLVVMPFVMNVITIIWISGKIYFIESLDKELYTSLKVIKKVFKTLYPTLQ